jgi:hypothetical protein
VLGTIVGSVVLVAAALGAVVRYRQAHAPLQLMPSRRRPPPAVQADDDDGLDDRDQADDEHDRSTDALIGSLATGPRPIPDLRPATSPRRFTTPSPTAVLPAPRAAKGSVPPYGPRAEVAPFDPGGDTDQLATGELSSLVDELPTVIVDHDQLAGR